jgi:hypothetical protein
MSGIYAKDTAVPIEKSRAEIEETLSRYGADGFSYLWENRGGNRYETIAFLANNKMVRFTVKMPSKEDCTKTPEGHTRHKQSLVEQAWQQSCRQRWRALLLCIKGKLEAVGSGISQFEEEFMAQIVDPGTGKTLGELILPEVEKRYLEGPGSARLTYLPEGSKT